jgi:putative sterol carrier protein
MASVPTFLESLQAQGQQPALRHVAGTIRFDIRREGSSEPWLVSIDDGRVSVSREDAAADCVAAMDEGLFADIASGRVNAFAAALRGEIEMQGQVALLLAFQRLFPGPPDGGRTRSGIGGAR